MCVHGSQGPVPGKHPEGHRMSHVHNDGVHSWEAEQRINSQVTLQKLLYNSFEGCQRGHEVNFLYVQKSTCYRFVNFRTHTVFILKNAPYLHAAYRKGDKNRMRRLLNYKKV
jgi:hypothetical protein